MPIKSKIIEVNWVAKWTYKCLNSDCPICRSSINTSDKKVVLGECGHGFHNDCLKEWFKQTGNYERKCPVCFKIWKENRTKNKISRGFKFFPDMNINNYNVNQGEIEHNNYILNFEEDNNSTIYNN